MIVTEGKRAGMVRRAATLFDAQKRRADPFAHRKLTDEARAGNPYVLAKLNGLGLHWDPRYGICAGRVTPRPTDNETD